jgi:hypothetical protein
MFFDKFYDTMGGCMEERRRKYRNKNSKISSLKKKLEFFQEELKIEKIKKHLNPEEQNDYSVIYFLEKTIRFFQKCIAQEIEKENFGFRYGMEKGKELFDEELKRLHKESVIGLWNYIKQVGFWVIITSPVIYSGIFFIALLDMYVMFFQWICFPVHKIPKVERKGYFIFERMWAKFLNFMQKLNCGYCSYGNGQIAYTSEVLDRIKHLWEPNEQPKIETWTYIKNINPKVLVTAILWYLGVFVIVLFDCFVTVYQQICFRVYKIRIVDRNTHFIFEKKRLKNMNFVQVINYYLGSYCLGVISRYGREIFSLTERYWCPIKHAKRVLGYHDRYDEFAEYGNPDEFFEKYMQTHGENHS